MTEILVVKLGALGDFVQALRPFAAIRRHHGDDRITLLTTAPFADFATAWGAFDRVWTEERAGWHQVGAWLGLRRRLRGGGFCRVYDLQTSDRSSFMYRLFWPGPYPEWSGIATGCSHPHANPRRDFMHTLERQAEQLSMAGVGPVAAPDLAWVDSDVRRFGLTRPYGLLVPGGAAHRPGKRWPEERFGAVAAWMAAQGIQPVVVGGQGEAGRQEVIADACAGVRGLAGETSLLDLARLALGAAVAVGNDSGPMHVAAIAGCPTVVLYSAESDPALCAQRGRAVKILRSERLADLEIDEVTGALEGFLTGP
jgi:ADP-heptose:LPS heptosyltransferase